MARTPTLRQRKVAKKIIESVESGATPTGIQILKSSNYSKSTSETKSTKIIQSEGVQQALEEYGFNEDNAKKVVASILLDGRIKPDTRINAAKEVFKVRGSYAPEKSQALNVNISSQINANPDFEALREEYESKLKAKLLHEPQ